MARLPLLFSRLIAGSLGFAAPLVTASAEEVVTGTAGLVPLPFTARNDGREPVGCGVATAHWYAVDLGTAAPAATIRQTFWASPASGAVFVLNAHGDRLPIQDLWCGLAGRAWETRALIPLARHAGEAPAAIDLACRADGVRLRCTARSDPRE